MTLLFVDGFDHYATADITKKWTTAPGAATTIASSGGRRGGGSLRSSTSVSGALATKTIAAVQTVVVGFAFKASVFNGNVPDILRLYDGATLHINVRLDSVGHLLVQRNSTTLGTSVNALSVDTWYYIEIKTKIDNTTGTYEVRVNGVNWVSGTGADTQNAGNASVNSVQLWNAAGSVSVTTDFDDFYLCDTAGSTNNDFLGDCRIDTLYPTSDGNYSQFTPSAGTDHFALVDETTPNTTDYNDGATVGDRDSYGMGNLSALASQTVYGVQVNAAVLKDDAGAKSAATFVRSSSTNGDGASAALGTSQVYVSQVFETNPNGSIAWTESSVNAMEAGVKVTA